MLERLGTERVLQSREGIRQESFWGAELGESQGGPGLGIPTGTGVGVYSGELQIPATERIASANTIRGHKGGQRESKRD